MDLPSDEEAKKQALNALTRSMEIEAKYSPGPSHETLRAAVEQLLHSERGAKALRGFLRMLDEGASGLDQDNLIALETMIHAMLAGNLSHVYEAVEYVKGGQVADDQ